MNTLLDTLQEIVQLIDCRQEFIEGHDGDPPPLMPEDYERLSLLLDFALEKNQEDPLLWFWRGWAYQFLQRESDSYAARVDFEQAEAAYMRALEINPEHGRAAMMLTCLYARHAVPRARLRAAIDHGFESLQAGEEIAGPSPYIVDMLGIDFDAPEEVTRNEEPVAPDTNWPVPLSTGHHICVSPIVIPESNPQKWLGPSLAKSVQM